MFSFKRVLALGLVFSAIGVVFSGCWLQSGNESGDSSRSNTFIFAQSSDPLKIDPHRITDNFSTNVNANVYEGLYAFEGDSPNPVPRLAVSYELSDDGCVYTFELKKGVKFHDGSEFNASVVKRNIDRTLEGSPTRTPDMEYPRVIYGDVSSVETENPHEVKIKLKKPDSSFIAKLSMPLGSGFISPKSLDEAKDNDVSNNPIGTGPFAVESWEKGSCVKLKRNENYHDEKRKSKFEHLVIKTISDPAMCIAALKNKEIDATSIDSSYEDVVKKDGNKVLSFTSYLTSYMIFNPNLSQEVRRAISQSIDFEKLVKSLYKGKAEVANSFLLKGLSGYIEDAGYPKYDPNSAKQIFESNKITTLNMDAYSVSKPYNSIGGKALAEAVAGELSKVGVEVKQTISDWPAYVKKLGGGNYGEIAFCGWHADYADSSNMLNLFTSDNAINYARFNNKEYDSFLKETQTLPFGDPKRAQIFTGLDKILAKDLPIRTISHETMLIGTLSNVENFKMPPVGIPNFNEVYKSQ
ncbi:MAG: ABC transporter substrate-binding protein [Oscillospiraceae bacterium]|jgi:peptide/nickel transport system substrate-binding protein|nr:ABC transporter substrate-binding protein [Oscillospiraceae bacterium]